MNHLEKVDHSYGLLILRLELVVEAMLLGLAQQDRGK